jgi:hypothetical protein
MTASETAQLITALASLGGEIIKHATLRKEDPVTVIEQLREVLRTGISESVQAEIDRKFPRG